MDLKFGLMLNSIGLVLGLSLMLGTPAKAVEATTVARANGFPLQIRLEEE